MVETYLAFWFTHRWELHASQLPDGWAIDPALVLEDGRRWMLVSERVGRDDVVNHHQYAASELIGPRLEGE